MMFNVNTALRPSRATTDTVIYVWRSFIRALNIFVVFPTLAVALLFAFGGGWTFSGVARELVSPVNYVVQGSTIAVRQTYCVDVPSQAPPIACKKHATRIVSIDQEIASVATVLRNFYLAFIVLTIGAYLCFTRSVFPKWPESRVQVAVAEEHSVRAEM